MRKSGLFPVLVLALFLALGFAVVWGVLVKFGYETVRELRPPPVEDRPLFLADGTPVLEQVRSERGRGAVPLPEPYRDLAGNPLKLPEHAQWAAGVALNRGPSDGLLGRYLAPDEASNFRIRRFGEPRDAVAWYLLCDGRR